MKCEPLTEEQVKRVDRGNSVGLYDTDGVLLGGIHRSGEFGPPDAELGGYQMYADGGTRGFGPAGAFKLPPDLVEAGDEVLLCGSVFDNVDPGNNEITNDGWFCLAVEVRAPSPPTSTTTGETDPDTVPSDG